MKTKTKVLTALAALPIAAGGCALGPHAASTDAPSEGGSTGDAFQANPALAETASTLMDQPTARNVTRANRLFEREMSRASDQCSKDYDVCGEMDWWLSIAGMTVSGAYDNQTADPVIDLSEGLSRLNSIQRELADQDKP